MKFFERFRKKKHDKEDITQLFRFKYLHFKELLSSNTELLNIITDIEEKLKGQQIFGMPYIRSQCTRAVFYAMRMVKNLNSLSNQHYLSLYPIVEDIASKIKKEKNQKKEISIQEFVLPYSKVNRLMVDSVGGKNANLGEIFNKVKLPIPKGFAITTYAYEIFLQENSLVDDIRKLKMEIEPDSPETLNNICKEIYDIIINSKVPPQIEEAILAAYEDLKVDRVSMRSSAIGEDSDLSFAGQYLSLLNVTKDKLLEAYKKIIASLYTQRAVSYRLNKGIKVEDIAMSVACIEMIDSVASGVMYSRQPFNHLENKIIISAVWGLGLYAVDGHISPDIYTVAKDKTNTIIEVKVANKPVKLICSLEGIKEVPVPEKEKDVSCLTSDQIKILSSYAIKLEEHYHCPQDIEWAIDKKDNLFILQTRPLRLQDNSVEVKPPIKGYEILIEKGAVACPGIGFGKAFHIRSDEDLLNFPDGAVLIAKHSSPKFVVVMQKAQGIIADFGSITGHMASLVREFKVPSILDAKIATTKIPQDAEITVDAYSGRIYQGSVNELLDLYKPRESYMKDTPVYKTLQKISEFIIPLNLLNPKASNFAPKFCETIHDVMRLIHEFSYKEMFQLSDVVSDNKAGALKLQAPIPIDLYIIDLGLGFQNIKENAKKIKVEQIASTPFRALLKGMLHEDLRYFNPRPVELSGFFSVMREQVLNAPNSAERFGDKSYALISDKYLNFSSRVGYHYSILDTYCGNTINKNYITFSFKGGAANEERRNRRVRSIGIILSSIDFSVDIKGDRIDARFQKYESKMIEERLDIIGRLLLFTRQMDMLMKNDESVEFIAKKFLDGKYSF